MKKIFAFRFPDEKAKTENLALFASSEISIDDITKILKLDIQNNLTPSKVFLIKPKILDLEIKFEGDKSFKAEFESFVGDVDEKFKIIDIDESGGFSNTSDVIKDSILKYGALHIFKKRKGIISSSSNYHFVKPSGDHCNKFIRAANLLTSGTEAAFLAIALLPLLDKQVKQIYIDTSSIAHLISTALLMSGKYRDSYPVIDSFNSYDLFNQSIDFVVNESSLVVISATTSGSMAKKILDAYNFNLNQLVTLFYTGLPSEQIGLYDISEAIQDGITSVKKIDCHWCDRGLPVIKIIDDQFLPETPRNESVVIRKKHFSSEREKFFQEFAARGILEWNKAPNPKDHIEHFYFDITKLLEQDSKYFKRKLNIFLNKYVSMNLETVVQLDDYGSKSLVNHLKNYIDLKQTHINWVSLDELSEEKIKGGQNTIVVAGAITSGRKLLSAARKLRGLNPEASIVYLVGVSKLPSKQSLEQLKKDLCLGGNIFDALVQCPLPRVKDSMKTAWDMEKELLSLFAKDDPLSDRGTMQLPSTIESRLDKLRANALSSSDMFYPNTKGEPLKLRESFAFWSELNINTDLSSQADVYWTIQSLLLDLRSEPDNGDLSNVYHSTFIDPVCFDRFNDGVIQACILRAAKPTELNYEADEDLSRKMTDILKSIIFEYDTAQGEAVLEFMLALSTRVLTIEQSHLNEILDLADEIEEESISFFKGVIRENIVN